MLKTDCQVVEINNSRKDVVTVEYLHKAQGLKTIQAKHVICSVPIQIVRNLEIARISEHKRLIFNNQISTNCIKLFAVFNSPFWV